MQLAVNGLCVYDGFNRMFLHALPPTPKAEVLGSNPSECANGKTRARRPGFFRWRTRWEFADKPAAYVNILSIIRKKVSRQTVDPASARCQRCFRAISPTL